jgi:soluble lytic murein transglycosylase-like protein
MRNYTYAVVLFLFGLLILAIAMWNSIIPPHILPQNDASCTTLAAPYNNDYALEACQDAQSVNIPAPYFVKQIYTESGFNPYVVSSTGDIGIAQFQLKTAQGLGINPYDPHAALLGAAELMSRYYDHYGEYAKALAAYNAGSGSLESAVSQCGLAWQSCLPATTQKYITLIMG